MVTSNIPSKDQTEKLHPEQKLKLETAGSMDKTLLPRSGPGRPRLSEHQLGWLEAIISVATADNHKLSQTLEDEARLFFRIFGMVTWLRS